MGVGFGLLGNGNEATTNGSEEEGNWRGIGRVWWEIEWSLEYAEYRIRG